MMRKIGLELSEMPKDGDEVDLQIERRLEAKHPQSRAQLLAVHHENFPAITDNSLLCL